MSPYSLITASFPLDLNNDFILLKLEKLDNSAISSLKIEEISENPYPLMVELDADVSFVLFIFILKFILSRVLNFGCGLGLSYWLFSICDAWRSGGLSSGTGSLGGESIVDKVNLSLNFFFSSTILFTNELRSS